MIGCIQDPVLTLEGDAQAGAVTWQDECGLCHGQEAQGTPRGSPLVGIFERLTVDQVLDTVRFGIDTMPAYGTALTDQDLADLLAWMEQDL